MSPQLNLSSTSIPHVEPIADYACEVGENPLWHPIERRVYWTDIPAGRLFRFHPATGQSELCYQGRPVGGFTIQADGALLLFMDRGTIALWRDGDLVEVLAEIPAERSSRFNDVIADPRGRVFCGTMSTGDFDGRLYRLDTDTSLHCLVESIGCSNGMAFTADRRTFYHTDSFAHEIYRYDYDIESGSICNREVFARFETSDGLPDGATLDREGHLWTALWDGSCIARLKLDGSIQTRIPLPTKKVSSLVFGGNDYSDLYITTAGGNKKEENGESAGSLFRFRPPVPGLAEFYSRIQAPQLPR